MAAFRHPDRRALNTPELVTPSCREQDSGLCPALTIAPTRQALFMARTSIRLRGAAMKTEQLRWNAEGQWGQTTPDLAGEAQLVLVFGSGEALLHESSVPWLRQHFPQATVFGCSTAGEIHDTQVLDETIVATAVQFERTELQSGLVRIGTPAESFAAGATLASAIPHAGLRHGARRSTNVALRIASNPAPTP